MNGHRAGGAFSYDLFSLADVCFHGGGGGAVLGFDFSAGCGYFVEGLEGFGGLADAGVDSCQAGEDFAVVGFHSVGCFGVVEGFLPSACGHKGGCAVGEVGY